MNAVLLVLLTDKKWICEFCQKENADLNIEGWTKPTTDDVTYLLEPAPVEDAKATTSDDDHNIIFVIDISGSMGATKQVVRRVFSSQN